MSIEGAQYASHAFDTSRRCVLVTARDIDERTDRRTDDDDEVGPLQSRPS